MEYYICYNSEDNKWMVVSILTSVIIARFDKKEEAEYYAKSLEYDKHR